MMEDFSNEACEKINEQNDRNIQSPEHILKLIASAAFTIPSSDPYHYDPWLGIPYDIINKERKKFNDMKKQLLKEYEKRILNDGSRR